MSGAPVQMFYFGHGTLLRVDFTREAIRLIRHLHSQMPDDTKMPGLLPLMLPTDARRPAPTRPDGSLMPWPGRIGAAGTQAPSPRGWPSSAAPWPEPAAG